MKTLNQTLSARIIALAILACASPIAAWADLSENTILLTGSALNLDTGAVVSSGGDILWNGSTLAPQGSATVYNVGDAGATNSAVLVAETFSIRRLEGSRWRLRQMRSAMGFECHFGTHST